TGPGGMALARQANNLAQVAQRALEYLNTASVQFRNQGMDPWCLFTEVQRAKALTDLQDLDAVEEVFKRLLPELDRFEIMASYFLETVGQIQLATGQPA